MKLQKFDYQIKPEKKNRSFVILSIAVVLLIAGFLVYRSFAAYKVTETYNIIKGSVSTFNKDTISLYYYLVDDDGNELSTDEVPAAEDYDYDATRSACESGKEIVYDEEANTVNVTSEDTEVCRVYFNYISPAKKTMIALGNPTVLEGTPDYTKYDETKVGYYKAKDNYGTTYYYYDANIENRKYVEYEGYLYTILRVNGDGTLRVMDSEIDMASISGKLFNAMDDNAYVGYMYGQIGADNYEATHANTTYNQYAYSGLLYEGWFPEDLLADSLFCNDRSVYNESYGKKEVDDTALGYGKYTTYYGAYYRLRNFTPSLMCDKNDSFTKEENEYGNGKLSSLNGFISADELMMTGLLYETAGLKLMTMTPWYFKNDTANLFGYTAESIYGGLSEGDTALEFPVFNLKFGLKYTGSGTHDDPYQIVTE